MSKKTDTAPAPVEDMTDEQRAQVGNHVSYRTTMIFGEAGRYTFQTNLPEECVEAFCHGILREGIELPDTQPGIRKFVRPREVILNEVSE